MRYKGRWWQYMTHMSMEKKAITKEKVIRFLVKKSASPREKPGYAYGTQ